MKRRDEDLVCEVVLEVARAQLRQPIMRQCWCSRCKRLWTLDELRQADEPAPGGESGGEVRGEPEGRGCPECGGQLEDVPF